MKQSRLDEIMNKPEDQLKLSELAEITGATLTSLSRHANDIKSKLTQIENRLALIEKNMDTIRMSQPVFGIIDDMEDEPD